MGPWCKLQRRAGFKWEALGKCPSNRNLKRTVYSDWEGIFLSLPLMLLSRKKYKEKTAANSLSVWTLCLYMLCVYQLLIVRVHLTSHQCHFLVSKLFPMSNMNWKYRRKCLYIDGMSSQFHSRFVFHFLTKIWLEINITWQ